MTLEQLFKIAQQAGNEAERRACYDKRDAFVYMDVTSDEYRKQVAKQIR